MKRKNHKIFYPWNAKDRSRLEKLNSPEKIQLFLDNCIYNKSNNIYSPSEVLHKKCAHCFDGAVFAASVLNYFGASPLIIDLCAVRDDDHIIAIFKKDGYFGAIAKSNYSGLRYREPIFKTERELVLSYFENYFNLKREKTLRNYSKIYNLNHLKNVNWKNKNTVFDTIALQLSKQVHFSVLSKDVENNLRKVDSRLFQAGLVGLVRKS